MKHDNAEGFNVGHEQFPIPLHSYVRVISVNEDEVDRAPPIAGCLFRRRSNHNYVLRESKLRNIFEKGSRRIDVIIPGCWAMRVNGVENSAPVLFKCHSDMARGLSSRRADFDTDIGPHGAD